MKTLKRMMSGALAVLLLVCLMAVPASADNPTYTITINNAHEGHTYEAYQIFSGTLAGSVLSNIVWGSGITDAGKTAIQDAYSKSNASDVAGTLTEGTVEAFADKVEPYLTGGTAIPWNGTNKNYTKSGLNAGYYFIKETTTSLTGEHAYSSYMLRIVNDVNLTPKSGTPTLTKEVKLGASGTYKNAISATVGDTVYFKLTASLHTYVFDYDKYYFRFEDALPAGLSYQSATVSVLSGATTSALKAENYSVNAAGNSVTVTIPDVHTAIKAASGADTVISDKIVVEIQAKVNSNVTFGENGKNTNTATLYFANDPNEVYGGDTPSKLGSVTSSAVVYAYQIQVTKVDAASATTKLQNAEFILGYKNGDGTFTWFTTDSTGKLTGTTANVDNATRIKTNSDGVLTFCGMASGTYHLREVVAPAQYNLPSSDFIVQFAGTLKQDTEVLDDLVVSSATGVSNYSADEASGTVYLTITNTKGATLPETGGMGTTIFYVVGIVLVAGAATVLFVKKRTGRN